MGFSLDDYKTVPERITEFREKYPEGSLQQVDLQFVDFAGASWVVYTAAAYRTPDDVRPGHGTAWEPTPGKTQFTKDSELQNAETAAWGRAIVAVLAADVKKGIASREEVQNRQTPAEPVKETIPAEVLADWVSALEGADDLKHLQTLWEDAGRTGVTHSPLIIAAKDKRKEELK